MTFRCPVCETDNSEEADECVTCGKALMVQADLIDEVAPIEGLEETVRDPLESAAGPVAPIPELEQTQLARRDLRVADEVVPGVERTQIEVDPSVASSWSGGVELDLGREQDDGARTPAPEDTGTCPWCGAPSTGAVCDTCGRRRARYSQAPARSAATGAGGEEDTIMCPACFARVQPGPRCVECGVPFPVTEV